MMIRPRFSLVIPCYNEAPSIPQLVEKAKALTSIAGGEVIFVDNGSTDGSEEAFSRSIAGLDEVRVIRVENNKGYGFGILAGLKVSRGYLVGWTHADLQTDPLDVLRALDAIGGRPGPVFVKGKRLGRPWRDNFVSWAMAAITSIIVSTKMTDINGQPTLFSRNLLREFQDPPSDFGLDSYVYFKARTLGYEVLRVPVLFPARKHGQSSWNRSLVARYRFIAKTIMSALHVRLSR
jgi:polyisoprenyl-phosphate glycosyltransferase